MKLLIFVLIFLGVGVLGMIYVPVVTAEATYHAKKIMKEMGIENGDWKSFFIPSFVVRLVPSEVREEFGISIPKIFVQDTIVPNVNAGDKKDYGVALTKGIAHAAGTSLPGTEGLGYYFAHSAGLPGFQTRQNAQFYLLNKLEPGDAVDLFYQGDEFRYFVTEKKVVSPNELGFLNDASDEEKIVLQTCWPPGTDMQRLLVFAERK